ARERPETTTARPSGATTTWLAVPSGMRFEAVLESTARAAFFVSRELDRLEAQTARTIAAAAATTATVATAGSATRRRSGTTFDARSSWTRWSTRSRSAGGAAAPSGT